MTLAALALFAWVIPAVPPPPSLGLLLGAVAMLGAMAIRRLA